MRVHLDSYDALEEAVWADLWLEWAQFFDSVLDLLLTDWNFLVLGSSVVPLNLESLAHELVLTLELLELGELVIVELERNHVLQALAWEPLRDELPLSLRTLRLQLDVGHDLSGLGDVGAAVTELSDEVLRSG